MRKLIDAEGKIAYQSMGYNEADFAKLNDAIKKELEKSRKK